MPPKIREHFNLELSLARLAENARDFESAWKHLARAHILSQYFAGPHVWTHILMLRLGLKTYNTSEILGQIPRLILAAPGSWFKKAPKGNTGLSNVGIFQPLEIPNDLKQLLSH